MKHLYLSLLVAMSVVPVAFADRCGDEFCECGRGCRCAEEQEQSKALAAMTISSTAELDELIAQSARLVVKFYPGRCSACAFGAYFNQLMADTTDNTTFATYAVPAADRAAVIAQYSLPSLPVIVLYEQGAFSAIIKK